MNEAAHGEADQQPGGEPPAEAVRLLVGDDDLQERRRLRSARPLALAIAAMSGWLAGTRLRCSNPVPAGEPEAREPSAEKQSDGGEGRGRNDHRANSFS